MAIQQQLDELYKSAMALSLDTQTKHLGIDYQQERPPWKTVSAESWRGIIPTERVTDRRLS